MTTTIVVAQTIIGLLGFWIAGAAVKSIIKGSTMRHALGAIWSMLIHGDLRGQGDVAVDCAEQMINNQRLTHFNVIRGADDARALAESHNRRQELAAATRRGIPGHAVHRPAEPLHRQVGSGATAGAFSHWPETLGPATFGSGMPIEDIAHFVGHANTRVTEFVYRKELRPVLTRGAVAMDALFPNDDGSRTWVSRLVSRSQTHKPEDLEHDDEGPPD